MFLDRYPQKITLKDGTELVLKAMNKQDEGALIAFFEGLDDTDRLYMRNDVSSYRVVREWFKNLNYNRVFPLLAMDGDRIVANATLHRKPFGWMRHVGEIRVVVSTDFRKRGLAQTMFTELIHTASEAGLDKLTAEMAVSQADAIEACRKMGFGEETIFKGYVKDARDEVHDLLVMTLDIEQ
jgi:RimJ/RimL family protein N-acetyltransferase